MSLIRLFFPRQVNFPDTKYNSNISLTEYLFQPTLFVNGLIQSGDIMTQIWKTGMKKLLPFDFKPQKILLLGLGGGSNANLCNHLFPDAEIIAVDIDKLMYRIGVQYFGLSKIKRLKFINSDALDFADNLTSKDQYDLILLDCFEGKYIPSRLENLNFLDTLKKHSRYLLINRIYWFEHHQKTIDFIKSLSQKFFLVTTKTRSNIIISLI